MDSKHPDPALVEFSNNRKVKRDQLLRGCLGVILIGILAMVVVVCVSPATGARGADLLRNLLGPKPVAVLEAFVFTIQDGIHQVLYRVERRTATAPWEVSTADVISSQHVNNVGSTYSPTTPSPVILNLTSTHAITKTYSPGTIVPKPTYNPMASSDSMLEPVVRNTPQILTSTPGSTQPSIQEPWQPISLPPLGNTPAEGLWIPYTQDQSNTTIAYKTFLQPDDQRPYALVGIVAFDLSRVLLHFQPGTHEPIIHDSTLSTGQIPSTDLQSGILLAAFNGGFKTINGHFGVFMNGKELIPPIDKMGTIAIYKDGSIRIGEWNTDLAYTEDMAVYRQNCPLMVHNGEINPLVFNNSVNDWGGTIRGNIVTFRSGIGISQDGKTFYYFAGNGLSMAALAKAMQDAGAYQAMQLDINSYYVLFTKFELKDNLLSAVPLLPNEMVINIDRFLTQYSHDFFYITAVHP
jgi:hypothetical protein